MGWSEVADVIRGEILAGWERRLRQHGPRSFSPELHLVDVDLDRRPGLVTSVRCRPYQRRRDAIDAICAMAMMAAAVEANRVLIAWDTHDITYAMSEIGDPMVEPPPPHELVIAEVVGLTPARLWRHAFTMPSEPIPGLTPRSFTWGPVVEEIPPLRPLPQPFDDLLWSWHFPVRRLDPSELEILMGRASYKLASDVPARHLRPRPGDEPIEPIEPVVPQPPAHTCVMRWELRDAGEEQAHISVGSLAAGGWYVEHTGYGRRDFDDKQAAWTAVRRLMGHHDGRWETVACDAELSETVTLPDGGRILFSSRGASLHRSWGPQRGRVWARFEAAFRAARGLKCWEARPHAAGFINEWEYTDPLDGATRYVVYHVNGRDRRVVDFPDRIGAEREFVRLVRQRVADQPSAPERPHRRAQPSRRLYLGNRGAYDETIYDEYASYERYERRQWDKDGDR